MTKQQRENRAKGLCGNGLHAWVEGQNQCMDCLREARRRWYEANTKKHREGIRRWREANPEKVQEANRRWYEANGEEERERNRRWRELNPEEDRERNRRWRDANPEKRREAEHRRRARLKGNGAYAVSDRICDDSNSSSAPTRTSAPATDPCTLTMSFRWPVEEATA